MDRVRARVRSQIAAVGFILLVLSFVPSVRALGSQPDATFPSTTWNSWTSVAWSYFTNAGGKHDCWNPTTGMTADACPPAGAWVYFTYWGLASNIIGVVNANKLSLISDQVFLGRVTPLLNSLNSIALDPSTGVPWGLYYQNTLAPAASWDSNPADYGRYLLAMYVLQQYLTQRGFTAQLSKVTSAVNRVNNSHFAGSFAGDLYGYYASLGFMLWGLIPSTTSSVQSSFLNLMQNGPFMPASSMYGVSGIPASTRIDGEPFIDAILELSNVALITALPSWCNFLQLSQKVYRVQEKRSAALSNTPQFWTGGGLDFGPGFVSEWIVWTTGQTWITPDLSDPRLPVAYLKLMFAYNALYGTDYTSNMLNSYASALTTSNGFAEGVYNVTNSPGTYDLNVQIQTQQIMLSSALSATIQTPSPNFCISVNPSSATISPGGGQSYSVTAAFLGGFSSSVSLSVTPSITGLTYSKFIPASISPSANQSAFQISTSSLTVKRGTFTITVTGTSGAIIHTATTVLTIITPLSLLSSVLLGASTNTVYFIFPDGNTAHHKPTGVGYASVTDWTALGFVYGSLTNMPQVVALDTNSAYINQNTGAPTLTNSIIVLFGGPLVNEVVHYYEANGISPLHWGLVGGFVTGTEYYYNHAGLAVASLSIPAIASNQDMGLIEAFTDAASGNTVIIFSGFGWRGTFVSGVYFRSELISQLPTMNNSWYIYSWFDSNGNGFPEVTEVNQTPVNQGN